MYVCVCGCVCMCLGVCTIAIITYCLLSNLQVIDPVLVVVAGLSVQSPFSRVPLGQSDISVSHTHKSSACAWLHGCMAAWVHGRMGAWPHGC